MGFAPLIPVRKPKKALPPPPPPKKHHKKLPPPLPGQQHRAAR
ncbi:hypothetical protein ABIA33_002073 [Streptacidiphilus sp. MAP12-16]